MGVGITPGRDQRRLLNAWRHPAAGCERRRNSLALAVQMYGDVMQLLGAGFVGCDIRPFVRTQLPSFSKHTFNVAVCMALSF